MKIDDPEKMKKLLENTTAEIVALLEKLYSSLNGTEWCVLSDLLLKAPLEFRKMMIQKDYDLVKNDEYMKSHPLEDE